MDHLVQQLTPGKAWPLLFAIGVGLIVAAFGMAWYPTAANLLTGYAFTGIPELYVPYWRFEPWLSVFAIAPDAYLISRTTRTV